MSDDTPSQLNNGIRIGDERMKSPLDRVVRGTVEETLNALLDAEADRLCNAQRYERSEARRDTRAGHYERGLQTKAGEVRLRVPKLRQQTFETAIIERYRRRESSVEEALIEMDFRVAAILVARSSLLVAIGVNESGYRGRPLDVDDMLRSLKLPVLVTHGAEDQNSNLIAAEYTAKMIPGAKLSIYEGVGHSLFFEAAPRFNGELAAFVRSAQKGN